MSVKWLKGLVTRGLVASPKPFSLSVSRSPSAKHHSKSSGEVKTVFESCYELLPHQNVALTYFLAFGLWELLFLKTEAFQVGDLWQKACHLWKVPAEDVQ